MALDRSSEARLRGSPMVREVGCSTNFALGKGLMAETSRTMVKWSASFDGCSGWRADLNLRLTPVAYCLFSAHWGNARSAPARPQRHLPAGEEVMARKWKGVSAAESVSPCRIKGYAFRPPVPASKIS